MVELMTDVLAWNYDVLAWNYWVFSREKPDQISA